MSAAPALVYATARVRRQAQAALPPGACVEVEVARRVERGQLSRYSWTGAVLENRMERWTHAEGWSEAPWVSWRLVYLHDTLLPRPASAPSVSAGWPASTGAERRSCSLKFRSYSAGGTSPSSSCSRSSL